MKSTISETTKIAISTLDECSVSKFEIVEDSGWNKILVDEGKYRWVEIYDDSVMVVYGKGFFKRLKYELILLDWVKDEADLKGKIASGIQGRWLPM